MRRVDWQTRFAAFAQERRSMPFSWGSNDCCIFAAAAVQATTGSNPMAAFEAYGVEKGARRQALRRLLRRIDKAGSLKALAVAHLGEPASPLMAAVGDVVLLMNEGREMLGICNGTNVLAPGKDGIATLDMTAAVAAWKI